METSACPINMKVTPIYDEENDADNCHCESVHTEFVSEGNLLAGKHHFYDLHHPFWRALPFLAPC